MSNIKTVTPEFVDALPDALPRASHSPFDDFRDALIEKTGQWAKLGAFKDRASAQSRASGIRNSRGKWSGHAWETSLAAEVTPVLDENDETLTNPDGTDQTTPTGRVEIYVRHTSVGQPEPSEASVARSEAAQARAAAKAAEAGTDGAAVGAVVESGSDVDSDPLAE